MLIHIWQLWSSFIMQIMIYGVILLIMYFY